MISVISASHPNVPHGDSTDVFTDVALAAGVEAGNVPVELLGDYLDALAAAAETQQRLNPDQIASCRASGRRAAEAGVALGLLIDLYLSATWRVWRKLPTVERARSATAAIALAETVLRVADDAVAAVAAGYDEARDATIRQEEAQRGEFVDDLLNADSDVGRLVDRAGRYGLQLAGQHAVAVVDGAMPPADSAGAAARIERALNDRRQRRGSERILVSSRAARMVCVFAEDDGTAGKSGESDTGWVISALSRAVQAEARQQNWRIGIGRSYPGPGGVSRSFAEAGDALDISTRLREPAHLVYAADLLIFQVIGRDQGALLDLVGSVLGPLATARGGAEPLVDTLIGYFAVGTVSTEAARRLHVSVRTVTYRLARIKALTGRDVAEPADRFVLQTAVLGAQLIGWPRDFEADPQFDIADHRQDEPAANGR